MKSSNEQKLKKITLKPHAFFVLRLTLIIIIALAIVGTVLYFNKQNNTLKKKVLGNQTKELNSETVQPNKYWDFTAEIYDLIKENYWNKIKDQALLNIYELAAEKITATDQNIVFKEKNGLKIMFNDITDNMDESQKKEFTVQLSTMVLANLEPFGRSGLFNEKQKQGLVDTVSNVDPNTDLYQAIGANKDTSQAEITQKYEQTKNKLETILTNPDASEKEKTKAQQKIALADRAIETLGNAKDRALYNQDKIESTVNSKILDPNTLYVHIKKISPTSFTDFQNTLNAIYTKNSKLNTLILDLRDNIGGSVDLMQWFLGPFIGPSNLAYEFYHQDKYEPFKTKTGWLDSLVPYKKVVILINGHTQSSAEVMAAALKKYNVGILLGEHTKGWGTIEKIFPLKNQISETEKYSCFLVHSLTLRDDNQPIEGHGVDPDININDSNWQDQLNEYYNSPALVTAIKKVL